MNILYSEQSQRTRSAELLVVVFVILLVGAMVCLLYTSVFENSKEAVTHFKVLERYGYHTLVECVLETGRTHQIRVHFAHIGHPVVNDPFYGYRRMDFPIEGQALHSHTLDVVLSLIHI